MVYREFFFNNTHSSMVSSKHIPKRRVDVVRYCALGVASGHQ